MDKILYGIVEIVTRIHNGIMTWNDSFETVMTDKELHFWIIGILGMLMLFVIFPLFKLLSKNHVLVIAWIYVFTLMIVITFAIEIGQGITHTGNDGLCRYSIWPCGLYGVVCHICCGAGSRAGNHTLALSERQKAQTLIGSKRRYPYSFAGNVDC